MAWPGDATSAPPVSGGFDAIELLFRAGPELWPMRTEIQAALTTINWYWSNPELQKLLVESPDIAAFVSKAIADPNLKAALVTITKLAGILAKYG